MISLSGQGMSMSARTRKILRRSVRILLGVAGFIMLAWLGLGWYINTHAETLKRRVAALLSEQVQGELHIGSLDPSVFRGFPDVSLRLSNVTLRDSQYAAHGHSLLEARNIFVAVNPFALLSRKVEIKRVTIAHGSIFLYADAAGYSNAYLLSRRDTTKKNRTTLINSLGMEDMHFRFVNEAKRKNFHLYFSSLAVTASQSSGIMDARIKGSARVHDLAFSTLRGSYLRDQNLRIGMRVRYHIANKRLEIPEERLYISGEPVALSGNFYFDRTPAAFDLHMHAQGMPYSSALAWMSPNIVKVMKTFSFQRPFDVDARISGVMQYRNIPLITVVAPIRENTLHTPAGDIARASFNVTYNNEVRPGGGHGDDNSSITLAALSGNWQTIPFTADTLRVTNLLRPFVQAHLKSSFPVAALNGIAGAQSFSFEQGDAVADLRYVGGILPDDTTPYAINGVVQIKNAALNYLPRGLSFSNVGATLRFEHDNLFFRDITLRSGASSVAMEGEALHFTRLYFADPGKIAIAWKVRGPMVNLNDFIAIAGRRKAVQRAATAQARAGAVRRIGEGLDRALEQGSVALDARIDKVVYKAFTAEGVVAQLRIAQSGIALQQIKLGSGGGTIAVQGMVNQTAANNPFQLAAQVRDADVAQIFAAFDNFGQDAIGAQNLAGRISADADVHGNVTEGGTLLPSSLGGTVTFGLEDGHIRSFAPFEKIGEIVFKKRNLGDVAVKSLKGHFDVEGNRVTIRPMSIQTSFVNMDVQGVYGLKGGTDIYIEVPLRNPERDKASTPIGALLRRGKGFVVHLRAQDKDGNGVKIGWDPLRRGKKSTEEKIGL